MTDGLSRDAAHRYFLDGEGPMPSVTTITKTLSTGDALVGWAKRETAACAVRNVDVLRTMIETGGTASASRDVRRRLTKAPWHARSGAQADIAPAEYPLGRSRSALAIAAP